MGLQTGIMERVEHAGESRTIACRSPAVLLTGRRRATWPHVDRADRRASRVRRRGASRHDLQGSRAPPNGNAPPCRRGSQATQRHTAHAERQRDDAGRAIRRTDDDPDSEDARAAGGFRCHVCGRDPGERGTRGNRAGESFRAHPVTREFRRDKPVRRIRRAYSLGAWVHSRRHASEAARGHCRPGVRCPSGAGRQSDRSSDSFRGTRRRERRIATPHLDASPGAVPPLLALHSYASGRGWRRGCRLRLSLLLS